MDIRLAGVCRALLVAMLLGAGLLAGCSESGENGSARNPDSDGEPRSGERSGEGESSGNGSGTDSGSVGEETTIGSTVEQRSGPETTGSVAGEASGQDRVLSGEWYVDSDENYVPDFVERDLGYDPKADDCAKKVNCPGPSGASGTSAVDLVSREQNALLILDSSGSMAEPIGGGQTKMDTAKESLERYATGTPDFINLGFMVYGHKGSNARADRAESCKSTEMLESLGKVDYRTFPRTLDTFEPTGWTPITGALNEAGETFSGEEDATNRVILVSDGLETCGGDPVAAARSLAASNVQVTIDVVGFDIPRAEEAQLQRIAQVSGGNYATVRSADELQGYFDQQQRVFYDLADQWRCMNEFTGEVSRCYTDFNIAVTDRMGEFLRDAEGAEYEAMDKINTRAYNYLENAQSRAYDANNERLDEISKDMDETERRMQQRYNEDVSFSPSCPDRPVHADFRHEPAYDETVLALNPIRTGLR